MKILLYSKVKISPESRDSVQKGNEEILPTIHPTGVSTYLINPLVNKRYNELNRQFSKEERQMANKYLKRSSTTLAIGNANENFFKIGSSQTD